MRKKVIDSKDMRYVQEEISIKMEVVLLNLIGKVLSAKDYKDINLIVVIASVLSKQALKKCKFVLVGLHQREILKHFLKE